MNGEIWLVHSTHGDNQRAVNKMFFETVIHPSFAISMQVCNSFVSRNKEVTEAGLFMCDGEMEQLDVLGSEEIVRKFQSQRVNVMKHSAGCSMLWQPNDVGHIHSSLHQQRGDFLSFCQ